MQAKKKKKQIWGFCFSKCLAVSMEGALNIISAVAVSYGESGRKKEEARLLLACFFTQRHVYGSRRTNKGKGEKRHGTTHRFSKIDIKTNIIRKDCVFYSTYECACSSVFMIMLTKAIELNEERSLHYNWKVWFLIRAEIVACMWHEGRTQANKGTPYPKHSM